jgi:carboxypeptidase Taq (EC:3.4.17.19). Metallo peptidase. MEROPS family M32
MSTETESDPDVATDTEETYEAFEDRVRKLTLVGDAAGVLQWDQEVVMPEGGTPARSQQLSTLSSIRHEILTDEQTGAHLDALADADLTEDRAAVVREVQRQYERADRVPTDLVERISAATSDAHPVWTEAKAEDDFEQFAPSLSEIVDLRRQYAEHIDPDRDPYAVLFEEYEPYLPLETAERVLDRLAEELPPMVAAIREADPVADPFDGEYPEDDQEALVRDALDTLGYDWEHGRLDTAPHPFSSGTPFDARVTTRFDPQDPLGALGSTIHEFGHATYTQGLPTEEYGTPLAEARDMTVHESQSRFWENHVGRTRAFWDRFTDHAEDHLDVSLTPEEAFAAANRVDSTNLIRVEADELTYHMHIVARFEIERDLITGDLAVEDVPGVWNEKYDDYLGVRPDTDSEGCLQDIHWSHGSFGYFPTYSLGSVLAAQIDAAMREDLDVDALVRAGEFEPIHEWLTDRVHSHGSRHTTPDLIEAATGEPLTADYFLEYARDKFSTVYDVSL